MVSSFLRAPSMGDNLAVKVHCGLGSRNCQPKARAHREVESEGSRIAEVKRSSAGQSFGPTNRNHI